MKSLDRPVTKIVTTPPPDSPKAAGRALLRIFFTTLYMAFGLAILASAFVVVVSSVTHLNVETAVTSAPLEQVVSADVGTIAEMNVNPGMRVTAGQPLFRVDSESVDAQRAAGSPGTGDGAHLAAAGRRPPRGRRKEARGLQNHRRRSARGKKGGNGFRDCGARCRMKELERYEALWNAKVTSRQLYDNAKARYDERAANVEHALAEQNVASTSAEAAAHGHFFSGNYLTGEVNAAIAEEQAANAQVRVAEAALGNALQQQSKRLYTAPFDAVVAKVFKSRGMTVDRGEALVVLRRTGVDPYIDAFLTQSEAGQLAAGAAPQR